MKSWKSRKSCGTPGASRRKLTISILLISTLASLSLPMPAAAAPPGIETALGPLGGRNVYAPHLPWFSFPAESAAALPEGSIVTRTGLYYINEFSAYPFDPEDASLESDGRLSTADQDALTAMDYESAVWELGIDWQAAAKWRFSADWRLHFRYGGFLDSTIDWWHSSLGVANAGREYFSDDRSSWYVSGSTISDFSGNGTVVASGDLDLRTLWSFRQTDRLSLAVGGAFKLPTGSRDGGFGSGYPDLGLAFFLDWRPWTRWIFYAHAGLIIPLGPEGRLMGQFMPSVEFRFGRDFSFLLQMNLQSSPVQGYEEYIHPIFGETSMFALPQIDFKIGFKGRAGRFGWQFYIEEDPLTWEGPDILIFFGADWSFRTKSSPG